MMQQLKREQERRSNNKPEIDEIKLKGDRIGDLRRII